MLISIIVAVSSNQVIGVDNQLPWHLPADLKYFKKLTTGHPILMGRKTYESIGRPLPKRTNIVITRDKQFHAEGLIIRHSIQEALNYCKEQNTEEVFVIGGDTIYRQVLPMADKIYLTRVQTTLENGDAFFPVLDQNKWELEARECHSADETNAFDYCFEVYLQHKIQS